MLFVVRFRDQSVCEEARAILLVEVDTVDKRRCRASPCCGLAAQGKKRSAANAPVLCKSRGYCGACVVRGFREPEAPARCARFPYG